MQDCLFCKIIAGEIPSKKVYEDALVFAFEDIAPQAPVHILVVPKEHMRDVRGFEDRHGQLLVHMMHAARQITEEKGISDSGYRLIFNTGADACQSVKHVHMHVLGGQGMTDRMA